MKKFTKLFLSCMAVSAITAAVATSAMAADIKPANEESAAMSGAYDETAHTIAVKIDGANADAQSTILVLAPGYEVGENGISADDIVYINQQAGADFKDGGLKGAPTEETAPGKYTVMVGYSTDGTDFKVATGTFSLGGHDVLVGDVTQDGDIGTEDASAILKEIVEEYLEGDALAAAQQCSELGDTEIGTEDASAILKWIVDNDSVDTVNKTVQVQ